MGKTTTQGTAKRSGSPLRRAKRGQKVTLYLPGKLVRELRMFAETERRSMSDAVSDAVERLLRSDRESRIEVGDLR